ncbi:SDR family NAD(P)-dependent oxidoreductase, partial [Enterobacter hormaechei]|uniref:SDR family NAD(P)-dependent oxidoreductase n=1 Tax=Enterobacter hormaechei TaxID=158836 RepID=UPI0013D5DCE1
RQQPAITPVAFDLAQTGGIDALARALLTEHPGIGILINNAGIQHDQRLDDASYNAAGIAEEIAINLTAPITLTRVLLPHLQQRTRATIVNV